MTDRRDRGRNCGTCDYWHSTSKATAPGSGLRTSSGQCRRRAPGAGGFAIVNNEDWCGEYVEMEDKVALWGEGEDAT